VQLGANDVVPASRGQARANSDSNSFNNSHIKGGNQVKITSEGDTMLKDSGKLLTRVIF
jgi:hypothetical protein